MQDLDAVPLQQRRLLLLEGRDLRTVGRIEEEDAVHSCRAGPAPIPVLGGARALVGEDPPTVRRRHPGDELAGELTQRVAVDAETAQS